MTLGPMGGIDARHLGARPAPEVDGVDSGHLSAATPPIVRASSSVDFGEQYRHLSNAWQSMATLLQMQHGVRSAPTGEPAGHESRSRDDAAASRLVDSVASLRNRLADKLTPAMLQSIDALHRALD